MSKLSLIFQIIKKSIFKPGLMIELAEEKSEMKDDEKFRKHEYNFDFESVNDFFEQKYPDADITKFELELKEIDDIVEQFFRKLKNKEYPSKEMPYPIDYSISSNSRKFLYILCRITKPKNVIETGVAYGLSSFYILSALNRNEFGKLTSIDSVFRPWQSEEMIGSIIPRNLRKRWKLVLGKSNEKLLDEFKKTEDVEIFIHDSLHSYKNMTFEFSCAIDNIKNNGIIISDDILDNDAFYDFTNNKEIDNSIIRVEDKGLGFIQKN